MDIESIKCQAVAAGDPIDLRSYAGSKIKVCFPAPGSYALSTASASDDDNCLPGEFAPYTSTDLCSGSTDEAECVFAVTEDDANCCEVIAPCGDFASFDGDVVVSGFFKQRRRVLGVGCGPDVNPNNNLPS